MYQSCMYKKCETIQRLVPGKRKHGGPPLRRFNLQLKYQFLCEGKIYRRGSLGKPWLHVRLLCFYVRDECFFATFDVIFSHCFIGLLLNSFFLKEVMIS